MDTLKRRRFSGGEPATIAMLPEELQLEILTWVPARELTRCKSVCKLWKSLIGSPPFLPLYRRRNRCLLAYWAVGGRIHFHYSPILRRRTEPEERFRRLGSLPIGRMPIKGPDLDPLTQTVNGVIVSGVTADGGSSGREPEVQLKVISVATGQALRIPPPSPRDHDTESSYSLGYDPRSRRYKLLRLIFRVRNGNLLTGTGMGMQADVITLGPFGSAWEWRKLDDESAGIRRLPLKISTLNYVVSYHEVRMFSGDGVLCWLCKDEGMILFDMDMERFRYVKLPANVQVDDREEGRRTLVPRVRMAYESLAIHLWVLPSGEKSKPELECFDLEDEEGRVWRKRSVGLRRELHDSLRWLTVANGSPLPDSSIVLMSCSSSWEGQRRDVYLSNGMRRFWVGQLRERQYFDHRNDLRMGDSFVRLSCLPDSNVLYLSLIDVLNGTGLV